MMTQAAKPHQAVRVFDSPVLDQKIQINYSGNTITSFQNTFTMLQLELFQVALLQEYIGLTPAAAAMRHYPQCHKEISENC